MSTQISPEQKLSTVPFPAPILSDQRISEAQFPELTYPNGAVQQLCLQSGSCTNRTIKSSVSRAALVRAGRSNVQFLELILSEQRVSNNRCLQLILSVKEVSTVLIPDVMISTNLFPELILLFRFWSCSCPNKRLQYFRFRSRSCPSSKSELQLLDLIWSKQRLSQHVRFRSYLLTY